MTAIERPTAQSRPIAAKLGAVHLHLAAISLVILAFLGQSFAAVDIDRLKALALSRYGDKAVSVIEEWRELLATKQDLPPKDRLLVVNDFFNQRIRWVPDTSLYNAEDYWATPLETMGQRAGDCEDFSIAKYVSLLLLGVDPKSLRLVYVKATQAGGQTIAHMVLAWYATPNADPLILDNINTRLLPASQRRDLKPVFSFNGSGLWLGTANQSSLNKPSSRLSRWKNVLDRMQREGILQTIEPGA